MQQQGLYIFAKVHRNFFDILPNRLLPFAVTLLYNKENCRKQEFL